MGRVVPKTKRQMKKILIHTMHRGNNYGSALQTYALSEKIIALGHNPIILDYIPDRINDIKNIKRNISLLFSNNSLRDKREALRGLLITITSYKCYNKFFKNHVHLTKKFYGCNKLKKEYVEADIYMTGSDQVWNSFHNQGIDDVFFLKYAPDYKRKVAYAASFGKVKLEEWEKDVTKKLLSRYDAISVREISGLEILKSIGINDAEWVLDPTLLLTADDWRERAKCHNNEEKYVLIYSVEPDKTSVIEVARSIADQMNAKVYMVEWGKKCYPGVDKMISLIDPLELIDFFDKAEYVVASSFHGTALSISLNKNFISLMPARFNARVESILRLTDLMDRLISPEEFLLQKALTKIDYDKVNGILNEERKKSIAYLNRILS